MKNIDDSSRREAKNRIRWITRTAMLFALLIAWQASSASLGNQFVTGSIVNMLLAVSVMTSGLASGLTVAAFSPVMAKFLNIGPLWGLIPFIAVGNGVYVIVWHFAGRLYKDGQGASGIAFRFAAPVAAAFAKFFVLYFGVVRIAIPFLLGLPERQAMVISTMFSAPQLINALIGGGLAALLLPALTKAIGGKQGQK